MFTWSAVVMEERLQRVLAGMLFFGIKRARVSAG
jgi:hypothetical protein